MSQTSVSEFASLEELNFTGQESLVIDFAVPVQGLRYDCRLNRREAADHMYVTFNSAFNRATHSIPLFARWNWHTIWRAPILSLFDPLLSLHADLRTGWFIGTREMDAADAAA